MMKRPSLIILVSALIFTCCAHFEESDSSDLAVNGQQVDIPADAIFGKWEMVSSSGGFSGVGYGRDIDFLLIQKDSTFSITRGTSIIATGKFGIAREDDNLVADFNCLEKADIEIELCNDRKKYLEFPETNKMSLNGLCCDSYNLHFVRQQ